MAKDFGLRLLFVASEALQMPFQKSDESRNPIQLQPKQRFRSKSSQPKASKPVPTALTAMTSTTTASLVLKSFAPIFIIGVRLEGLGL